MVADVISGFQWTIPPARWPIPIMSSRSSGLMPLNFVPGEMPTIGRGDAFTASARAKNSSGSAKRLGTGAPEAVVVGRRRRRGEAGRAGGHGVAQQARHGLDLLGRGGPLERVVAHHVAPDGRVADLRDVVDPEVAVELLEVLGEALPVPAQAFLQRLGGHALDACQQLDDVVVVTGVHRRHREAAVAGDHRGDAVARRRRQLWIPQELGVVVGVDVDEPGRHDEPGGVDGARRRSRRCPARCALIFPSVIATSALNAGAPVPSTTVPPRNNRSMVMSKLCRMGPPGSEPHRSRGGGAAAVRRSSRVGARRRRRPAVLQPGAGALSRPAPSRRPGTRRSRWPIVVPTPGRPHRARALRRLLRPH